MARVTAQLSIGVLGSRRPSVVCKYLNKLQKPITSLGRLIDISSLINLYCLANRGPQSNAGSKRSFLLLVPFIHPAEYMPAVETPVASTYWETPGPGPSFGCIRFRTMAFWHLQSWGCTHRVPAGCSNDYLIEEHWLP